MRVLFRSYDMDGLGGSGVTMLAIAQGLEQHGVTVWANGGACGVDEVRAWSPDIIVTQHWATEEANRWAIELHKPLVMLVHGPGQYQQFWPTCDLVIFNTHEQHDLAARDLGRTPAVVVYPPVWRDDYAAEGTGDHITLVGRAPHKGIDIFLSLAWAMPEERFLLVAAEAPPGLPPNVEVASQVTDMREVYARTKLLLMPSRHEEYGRVAIEAAMSGIPTVASDLSGVREATAGRAVYVARPEGWLPAVRTTLADLEPHRIAARELAALRDPANAIAALHEQLSGIAAAGRRRPTLSLCMTVANEAASLEQAVMSVAGVVDEIIIGVDTKSVDATGEIARRLATDVFEFSETSPPDFRRMRNRAMERVQTDWALFLDGHEWIEGTEHIRPALETTAWSIEIQTLFEPDEQRVPGVSFPFPRIHRRSVRFAGTPAHEEVDTPMDRRIQRPEIRVWHERKAGQAATTRAVEKSGSELDVLRDAWETHGDRRALFYLANGLRESGRWPEAIAAYQQYLESPAWAEEGWQARLYLARCHAANGDPQAARRAFEQAVLDWPERAEAIVGLGYVLLELGDERSAAAWFRMAAALPQPLHARLFVEVPVYRWGAWHGLALALDRLGDCSGAAEAEERALHGGAGAWARENIAMWRQRAAQA